MPKHGNQTPTQSHILPYVKKRSKVTEALELYERTGNKAQKWQVEQLRNILAVNKKGLFVHTKYGYSVPRRNGKNEIVAIREFWGLVNGEKILHTGHRTSASTQAFERLYKLLCKAGYVEKEDFKATRQKGLEKIILDGGGEASFRTRSSKGGLGEGFDLLVIDEAQEYTDDQETALKYVVSDSKNPQTLFCGTPPTAVSAGTVFLKMRNETLAGKRKNTGWAEWSVEKLSDVHDVSLWYLTNPAMGNQLDERKIADEITTDDIDFNIQRLGLWLQYDLKSVISRAEWDSLRVQAVPELTGKLFAGVKYGKDGTNAALSIAVRTMDDRIFVEAIDCRSIRSGNDWILSFLAQADIQAVAIDGESGREILTQAMAAMKLKKPIAPTVKEVILPNSYFEQAIIAGKLCHMGQPSLAEVASSCTKRSIQSNGGFGYKSLRDDLDIALLDSVILAHWACSTAKAAKKQTIRY